MECAAPWPGPSRAHSLSAPAAVQRQSTIVHTHSNMGPTVSYSLRPRLTLKHGVYSPPHVLCALLAFQLQSAALHVSTNPAKTLAPHFKHSNTVSSHLAMWRAHCKLASCDLRPATCPQAVCDFLQCSSLPAAAAAQWKHQRRQQRQQVVSAGGQASCCLGIALARAP
jgi:hypothetical protein